MILVLRVKASRTHNQNLFQSTNVLILPANQTAKRPFTKVLREVLFYPKSAAPTGQIRVAALSLRKLLNSRCECCLHHPFSHRYTLVSLYPSGLAYNFKFAFPTTGKYFFFFSRLLRCIHPAGWRARCVCLLIWPSLRGLYVRTMMAG